VLVAAYFTLAWVAVGRDPAKGTIFPRFEPPGGMSPAAARFLMRMGYDIKCLSAAILDMAVKGYLTVEERDGVLALRRTDADESELSADERKVASALFRGSRERLRLVQRNHARVRKAMEGLRRALVRRLERRYFVRNSRYVVPGAAMALVTLLAAGLLARAPDASLGVFPFLMVWLLGWTAGLVGLLGSVAARWRAVGSRSTHRLGSVAGALSISLLAVPFVLAEVVVVVLAVRATSPYVVLLALLLGAFTLLFYRLLKAPTRGGRSLMDALEGFRMYLGTAERHRLEALTPPERTPELFEKYLPYAVALDVENRWAAQFSDVLRGAGRGAAGYAPAWYHGSAWRAMGPAGFAASIGGSFGSAIASSSRAPGSRSGSGGGGFSGGGMVVWVPAPFNLRRVRASVLRTGARR